MLKKTTMKMFTKSHIFFLKSEEKPKRIITSIVKFYCS